MACLDRIWPLALSLLAALLACPATAATGDRERRCLAMIAYAEAATDGPAGMLAVIKVVHNRIADPRFADDACAVALERNRKAAAEMRKRGHDVICHGWRWEDVALLTR